MVDLFHAANRLLHGLDKSFPLLDFTEADALIRHDFYGGKYAEYTHQSVEAMHRVHETEAIKLEGTYTGKAFAALIADAKAGLLHGKTVLFWNTYNSRDLSNLIATRTTTTCPGRSTRTSNRTSSPRPPVGTPAA